MSVGGVANGVESALDSPDACIPVFVQGSLVLAPKHDHAGEHWTLACIFKHIQHGSCQISNAAVLSNEGG